MNKELKFEDISMTDFIRMAKKNGYEVQLNEDKKFAIECLKETKNFLLNAFMSDKPLLDIYIFIDNKIKELEGK